MQEETFTNSKFDLSLWKKLWALLIVHRKKLYKAFFIMALVAVCDVIFPILNRNAIDTYITNKDYSQLFRFVLIYGVFIILQGYLVYKFIYNNGQIEMDLAYDLRRRCMEKLQNQSFAYYDKNASGWILSRVTSDIARLSEVFAWALVDMIWGITMLIGISFVMLMVNWRMLVLTIITVPIILVVSYFFQKRILASYREVRKTNSQITASFSEGIMGAKTTKTMSLEKSNYKAFSEVTNTMNVKSVRAGKLSALYNPIISLLTSVSVALLLGYGSIQVQSGSLTPGTLLMYISYANIFFQPIKNIAAIMSELQMAQASAERVLSLLEAEITVRDSEEVIEKYGSILKPKVENYEAIEGKIEFKQVDFSYIPQEPILQDFNLMIKPGQTIALVGETGSGKSTISNLLARFYEPTGGQILIDDIDYTTRSIGWLHSSLGVVLQAPHLFSGTIKENIKFGKLDATDEEVINVAKMVNAHDFIMNMDKGYDSEVGEGGSRLSSGQKQLISFARALIGDPSIIILDEATASIDTKTERHILEAIEVLLKNRTAIVVAHRLSTIVSADKILVIDKGKIVEQGNHLELMNLKGRYHNLYTNQFQQHKQEQLLKGA